MGYNFRKSINIGGGFKINLSKSGIGYSFKIPGGRITRTAAGKLNYNYTGFKKKKASKDNLEVKTDEIENADIKNFQSVEYRHIINKITRLLWINRFGSILSLFALASFFNIYFLIFLGVGLILKILVRSVLRINLEYALDEENNNKYNKKVNAWLSLNKCDKLWQVVSEIKSTNKKAIAGINRNVVRKEIKVKNKAPYFLSINTEAIQIKLNKETLYILPDKLLIIRGCRVVAISYNNINVKAFESEYVESSNAPNDAKILDYRWQ